MTTQGFARSEWRCESSTFSFVRFAGVSSASCGPYTVAVVLSEHYTLMSAQSKRQHDSQTYLVQILRIFASQENSLPSLLIPYWPTVNCTYRVLQQSSNTISQTLDKGTSIALRRYNYTKLHHWEILLPIAQPGFSPELEVERGGGGQMVWGEGERLGDWLVVTHGYGDRRWPPLEDHTQKTYATSIGLGEYARRSCPRGTLKVRPRDANPRALGVACASC